MKLQYLGTAAAEGWPAFFCHCEACKKAAEKGGRNIRSRSQAIVDGELLIDFPPDSYMHFIQHGIDLPNIKHLIITHPHSDHLFPQDLANKAPIYAHFKENTEKLTIYGSEPVGTALKNGGVNFDCVEFKFVEPYVAFNAGGYSITPLKANHDAKADPYIYIIKKGQKCLLYAHDTGIHMPETWEYLEKTKPHFDMISLDCTMGITKNTAYHMGLECCAEFAERLESIGAIGKDTVKYINHFSHNGLLIYDDMVEKAAEFDFKVSYDGLEVEF